MADDEIFRPFCLGGEMRSAKGVLDIIPKDGVRCRLHLRTAGQNIDLELVGARFAKDHAIEWHTDGKRLVVPVETASTSSGKIGLSVKGLPAGNYKATCSGRSITFQPDGAKPLELDVPAGTAKAMLEIVRS